MAARLDYGLRSNFNQFLPERGLLFDGTNVSGNLFDLQVNGSSKFKVDKTGSTIGGNITLSGNILLNFGSQIKSYTGAGDGEFFLTAPNNGNMASISDLGFTIGGGFWFASTTSRIGRDLFLGRDAANILTQRNSTSAQTFRLYNTYTDASNYERAVFDWQTNTNILTIGTQNAGTGSARDLRIIANNNTVAYFSASGVVTVNNSISIGNSTVNTSITPTTATLINLNPLLLMGS